MSKSTKKTSAPVKPGKRREEPAPVKASKPATPPAKPAPKGKRAEPAAPVKATKASAKPATPAPVEPVTAYVVGGQTFPFGAACSVLWPEPHGRCEAIVIAPDDARIMDRPIPRLKRGAPVRVFYPSEGVWMDHGADQIMAAVKAPKGKASKPAPVETSAKRKPAGKRAA